MSAKKAKAKKACTLDERSLPALPSGWNWATVQQLAAANEQPVLTGPFGSTLGR